MIVSMEQIVIVSKSGAIDTWSCFFKITLVTVINETFTLHFYMVFNVNFLFEFINTLVAVIKNTFMLHFYMAF